MIPAHRRWERQKSWSFWPWWSGSVFWCGDCSICTNRPAIWSPTTNTKEPRWHPRFPARVPLRHPIKIHQAPAAPPVSAEKPKPKPEAVAEVAASSEALLLPPETLEQISKGMALTDQGKFERAQLAFEKAAELSPESAEVYAIWGSTLRHPIKIHQAPAAPPSLRKNRSPSQKLWRR